jgi:multicomponent Na+:H+ antiporter subunit F
MNDFLSIMLYLQIALAAPCLYRIIRGPTIPDRMVGIDIFGILVVASAQLSQLRLERILFWISGLHGSY